MSLTYCRNTYLFFASLIIVSQIDLSFILIIESLYAIALKGLIPRDTFQKIQRLEAINCQTPVMMKSERIEKNAKYIPILEDSFTLHRKIIRNKDTPFLFVRNKALCSINYLNENAYYLSILLSHCSFNVLHLSFKTSHLMVNRA